MGEKLETIAKTEVLLAGILEAKKNIELTVGEMQKMFDKYEIEQHNTKTSSLEIATKHNITTAQLLAVIKYYENLLDSK